MSKDRDSLAPTGYADEQLKGYPPYASYHLIKKGATEIEERDAAVSGSCPSGCRSYTDNTTKSVRGSRE
jgi:hypothetical protein